jgi:regulatory protein
VDERNEQPGGKPPFKRKQPRKISPRYLENSALHYLKRYSATVAQLRRVMTRKIDRSTRAHGGDRAEALKWLEELIAKLVRNGLVNDQAYAEMKARSLRASGRSSRVIALKLQLKGVDPELASAQIAGASEDVSEEQAATIWARKKRLGPYRRDPSTREDSRQKDLAAMARAGFSFGLAKRVIDGEPER